MPPAITPGSLVFAHTSGFFGWIIRLGQKLHHPFRNQWWTWNHVAIVTEVSDNGIFVVQAMARGVKRVQLDEVAPGGRYVVVPPPKKINAKNLVAFANEQVGVEYGFVSILSIALNLFTPRAIRIDFRRDGTLICSALAALSLLAGGWLQHVADYYAITPADLAELFGVNNSDRALLLYVLRNS